MKKLLFLLVFIPLVSFGQKTFFADFSISPKYIEAYDERLASLVDESVIYHKESAQGKINWAKETKTHTRMYYLRNGTKFDFILIKKQLKLNELIMYIDSKSIEFLNMWNKMKEDMYNKEENPVVNFKYKPDLIDSGFGTLHSKYNYMYSINKLNNNNLPPYENTYWININNILYSIHVKSINKKHPNAINDVIIGINN